MLQSKAVEQKGFTLVELLIVVIILAILAAIVVPQFSASTDDATSAAVQSNLSAIRQAQNFYFQQHGEYPGKNEANTNTACGGTDTSGAAAESSAAIVAQLTLYSDADGATCDVKDAVYKYGPYLREIPTNATTDSSTIVVSTTGSLNLADGGESGGWKIDTETGGVVALSTP